MSASLRHALADLLQAYTADTRLMSLRFDATPADDGFVVVRLSGREALSRCYRYEIDCVSAHAGVALDALVGRRLSVSLAGAAAGPRHFNGIVTRAQQLGEDGALAAYRLRVEPALALLGMARVTRIYQERSVPELLDDELALWRAQLPDLQWRWSLLRRYPQRGYTTLYDESPLAALDRLTREEGIYYYFEPLPPAGEQCVSERLVLVDDVGLLPQNAQAQVRRQQAVVDQAGDCIDRWEALHGLAPGAVALATFDYKRARVLSSDEQALAELGSTRTRALEDFDPYSAYAASSGEDQARYARLRMEAHEAGLAQWRGEGGVASFMPGTCFRLAPRLGELPAQTGYLLLEVEHEVRNNLPAQLFAALPALGLEAADGQALAEAGYRNRFVAQSDARAYRPPLDRDRSRRPAAPGLQTAIVVGPQEGTVHTDERGRVRVRFSWDREGRCSLWLRVASPSAGAGWGQIALPRVGQEVLVGYLESDVDRPVVLGALHNGRHPPPYFSGAGELPGNRNLSGIQSCEIGGSGYGQLLFDDTPAQTKTMLSSEHGKSQLSLGWASHPRRDGQTEGRGEGLEARTDFALALRGGAGVLLSAWARERAAGAMLAREELLTQCEADLALARELGALAQAHQAGGTEIAGMQQLHAALQAWGARGGAGVLAATAPEGIALNTPEGIAAGAGRQLDMVAGQDANLSAGRRLCLRAARGLSAFVHKLGISLVAAAGKIQLQAQADELELGAAKRLHAWSLDALLLQAPAIVLKTPDGTLTLDARGITLSTRGEFKVLAAQHSLSGGGGGGVELPGFTASPLRTDEQVALAGRAGQALAGVDYILNDASGGVRSGQSAADGSAGAALMGDALERLTLHARRVIAEPASDPQEPQ